mmetsp:Transcript_9286/g.13704  ORF Transcript_9286/g.13704 Transcript_9286/m.13704 type:complete len:887 (+) Transcript_9286:3-2663(+)
MSDGKAYVHKRAFLHVANEDFYYSEESKEHPTEEEGEEVESVMFDPSVHISNCCANSHDVSKFAGEICADFELSCPKTTIQTSTNDTVPVISLSEFFPSIQASVSKLAQTSFPFLRGGEANNGFEYMGLDFMLSYKYIPKLNEESGSTTFEKIPVAYMLEVNAPPSQDTATGLSHAEDLHDEVLSDLMKLWVIPHVMSSGTTEADDIGGWRCVYDENSNKHECGNGNGTSSLIVPSKAAILNKVRWAICERKMSRAYEEQFANNHVPPKNGIKENEDVTCDNENIGTPADKNNIILLTKQNMLSMKTTTPDDIAKFARRYFPFFFNSMVDHHHKDKSTTAHRHRHHHPTFFFENAGGAQIPITVLQHMNQSLIYRDRCRIGSNVKSQARSMLYTLLGGSTDHHYMFLGCNATSLLRDLAKRYADDGSRSGFVKKGDEIIIRTENHLANVLPWVELAQSVGDVTIRWWTTTMSKSSSSLLSSTSSATDKVPLCSAKLQDLITSKTRIVAVSHASNILGQVRNIQSICCEVKSLTSGKAHVIVDGVAAVPHIYSNVDTSGVDFYVVSCHKLFGPHLGGLCARKTSVLELMGREMTKQEKTVCGSTDVCNEDPDVERMSDGSVYQSWEVGTLNYEGCSGVVGLGEYFSTLARFDSIQSDANKTRGRSNVGQEVMSTSSGGKQQLQTSNQSTGEPCDREEGLSPNHVQCKELLNLSLLLESSEPRDILQPEQVVEAYRHINTIETSLMDYMLSKFRSYPLVRIIEEETTKLDDMNQQQKQFDAQQQQEQKRLPILSFIHDRIKPSEIVRVCYENGIACRHGTFLSTDIFMRESNIGMASSYAIDDSSIQQINTMSRSEKEGLVRLSLAHYNTKGDIDFLLGVLESMEDWC